MSDRSDFRARLKRQRQARGLTQDELGELVGYAGQTIRKIEGGQRRPSPQLVLKLAQVLQLPSEEHPAWLAAARATAGVETAATESAPARGLGASPGLPVYLTPCVGREHELAVLEQLLQRPAGRLLTITGPGGVGKTRTAHALLAQLAQRFARGTAWVSLAPLTDGALLLATIAQALGLPEAGGSNPRATLQAYLSEQQLLLVLDNFEQLLDASFEVSWLLEACPQLKVLVTSRAPLQLGGEQVYPLGPLAVPSTEQARSVAELTGVAAVQLFVQRTQHTDPAFVLTPQNAALVSTICQRLDGLPLALELAAPRVRLLGLPTLLARLDHALPLLSSGARDLPDRQRTIEATIRWSYDLLTPAERALFRRLAVFAGGATLAAVEDVGVHTSDEHSDVLDRLGQLVAQSLVQVDDSGQDVVRYRLLEPVRQFAQAELARAGEEQDARMRHAYHYARGIASRGARLRGPEQTQVVREITAEIDNLRATWHHAAATRNLDLIWLLQENATYTWFFELRSWYVECEAMCRRMAEALQTPPPATPAERTLLGNMISVQGWFVFRCGDPVRGLHLLEEGGRLVQHGTRTIFWFHNLAQTCFLTNLMGQTRRAIAAYKQMAEVWDELDDELKPWSKTFLIQNHATTYAELAPEVAHDVLVEGLPFLRRAGEQYVLALALFYFGRINLGRGDLVGAEDAFAECLQVATSIGNGVCTVLAHTGLAQVACAYRNWTFAVARCELALELAREVGDVWSQAGAMATLGEALSGSGNSKAAREVYREVLDASVRAQVLGAAVRAWLGLLALEAPNADPSLSTLTTLALLRVHPSTAQQNKPLIEQLWQSLAARADPQLLAAAEAAAQTSGSADDGSQSERPAAVEALAELMARLAPH